VILPVVNDDRRYLHTFGANAELRASDIDDAALDAAEVVYVGGYLNAARACARMSWLLD